jgi:indoleacetate---lysine synthetase
MQHTGFNADTFNRMIESYRSKGLTSLVPVNDYTEFCSTYELSNKHSLKRYVEEVRRVGPISSNYVIKTSGTTGVPLVLLHESFDDVKEDSFQYELVSFLIQFVIVPEDKVLNLFTPGGLSMLYEGTCRMLEPTGATILPQGALSFDGASTADLAIYKDIGVNVIMGAPTSVMQLAQLDLIHKVGLNVTKVVFTGEEFFEQKRQLLRQIWPSAKFISLYGATEFGFVAIGLPEFASGRHHIFTSWFFLECDDQENIFVTSFCSPTIPIIRYRVGDKGKIETSIDGTRCWLKLSGRADHSFNFVGNILSYEDILRATKLAGSRDTSPQIVLSTHQDGADEMLVLVSPQDDNTPEFLNKILLAISHLPQISEGLARRSVRIQIQAGEKQLGNRSKVLRVVDLRSENVGGPTNA